MGPPSHEPSEPRTLTGVSARDALGDLVEALPVAAMVVHADHTVECANGLARRAAGLTATPSEQLSCAGLCLFQAKPDQCPLEEALQTGEPAEHVLLDPTVGRWLRCSVLPLSLRGHLDAPLYLHLVTDITPARQTEVDLAFQNDVQRVLARLVETALHDMSLEEQLGGALDLLWDIPWLALERRGAIFVRAADGSMRMAVHREMDPVLLQRCATLEPGRCLCGLVLETRQLVFAAHTDERHHVRPSGMQDHGHYCVPVMIGDSCEAILNLYLAAGHVRSPREEDFLVSVAQVLAGLLRRRRAEGDLKRTVDQLRRTTHGVVGALSATVEFRDPYTAGHQRRVAVLATALARELGLDDERIEGIRVAATVHDLGKIAVPAEILTKPGRLSPAEFGIIKIHPTAGWEILRGVDFPWPVARVAHEHHEALDGSGYPRGLHAADILLESRIVGVADVVEAIASHRPYRPSLGVEFAMQELRRGRGTRWDPRVIDACERLFAAGRLQADFALLE